jgi:hypothetical protein
MVELVDALVLGTSAARRGGSSPSTRTKYWGISSVGRAPDLHSGGQRFEPAILHQKFNAGVAQW